jgi:hypothetical protein
MALSHHTSAVLAIAIIGGGLVAPALISLGTETLRSHIWRARVPGPAPVPCDEQFWVNADRACLTWTAPRPGGNAAAYDPADKDF